MYQISIEYYNHVSGYGSYKYYTVYKDLNMAKRKLVELALADENLFDEDATCEISKNMDFAYCTGRHNDYSHYFIETIEKYNICNDKAAKLTKEEVKELIDERLLEDKENTLTICIR